MYVCIIAFISLVLLSLYSLFTSSTIVDPHRQSFSIPLSHIAITVVIISFCLVYFLCSCKVVVSDHSLSFV